MTLRRPCAVSTVICLSLLGPLNIVPHIRGVKILNWICQCLNVDVLLSLLFYRRLLFKSIFFLTSATGIANGNFPMLSFNIVFDSNKSGY